MKKPFQPTYFMTFSTLIISMIFGHGSACAWGIHPLLMKPALSQMEEISLAPPLESIPLSTFLTAVETDLEIILAKEEAWFRTHLDWYAPLPESLTFKATGDKETILSRFAHAIRVNPDVPFKRYLQKLPGESLEGLKIIPVSTLTTLMNTNSWYAVTFVQLSDGATASALDIISTATDEPDFGMDVGLFENNRTDFGSKYGFGNQPFGNPNLEYGSQAPFHMGFYHESPIIYLAAGFVKQTYPEYRIRQCQTLARLAFRTGHEYWGWRFLGWGLHYLVDLMQPYHAALLPGYDIFKMLWINTKASLRFPKDRDNAIQLVSNRHSVFEQFQQEEMIQVFVRKNWQHPVIKTLTAKQFDIPVYHHRLPREVVAKNARLLSNHLDEALSKWAPGKFVSDPDFEFVDFEHQKEIVNIIRNEKGDIAVDALNQLISTILKDLLVYSQSYIRSVLNE